MKFSVRMFRQMVLHVLYLERENGNVLYHLPEKRVVPIEKQIKRYIFSGTCNCGQMVQKFPSIPVKARKRNTSKGITFFPKTFHRDEPFHLNSLRNYRKFHSNGKRSWLSKFQGQGPVSLKSRKLFGPEKPFVKLRPTAYFRKPIF